MKKNKNKKHNKFDLGKVSGGLTLGGGLASGGALNLVDQSKETVQDLKSGNISSKKVGVDIGLKVKTDGAMGAISSAAGMAAGI